MSELLAAFGLGNSAILTNVCLLPLYPGLIAFLAGSVSDGQEQSRWTTGWLGVLVLAGVLSTMLLIGLVLYLLQRPFASILPVVLPLTYGLIIVLGIVTLAGWNPFTRLATMQSPILRNRQATAYLYGVFLAPLTLPCTGPFVLSTFVLGAGSAGALLNEALFFLAVGLGFGWPLVLLPLLALPVQRRFVGWLREHHLLLTRVSGILLIGIGVAGIWFELLPEYGLL